MGGHHMKPLLAVASAIDRINELIGKAVAWLILASVLVSAINAIVRKVLSDSSNKWLEMQWYLFGAAFLLAAAYTLKQNEHVRIDVLYARHSRRVQHWIDLFGHLVFLMPFVTLMIWYLTPWAIRSYVSGEMSNNSGGLILWPAKMLLLAGFVLLWLQGLSEIIKKIAVMAGHIADPHAGEAPHGVPLAVTETPE